MHASFAFLYLKWHVDSYINHAHVGLCFLLVVYARGFFLGVGSAKGAFFFVLCDKFLCLFLLSSLLASEVVSVLHRVVLRNILTSTEEATNLHVALSNVCRDCRQWTAGRTLNHNLRLQLLPLFCSCPRGNTCPYFCHYQQFVSTIHSVLSLIGQERVTVCFSVISDHRLLTMEPET